MQTPEEIKARMDDLIEPMRVKLRHMRDNMNHCTITNTKREGWLEACTLILDYLNRLRLSVLDSFMQEKAKQWAQIRLTKNQQEALSLTNFSNDKLQTLESIVIDLADVINTTKSTIETIKEKLNVVCCN